MIKEVVALPARTVTETGTGAAALVEESLTDIPPEGASPDKVTTPATTAPPGVVVGVTEIPVRDGGLIVRVAVLVVVPFLAVIVAVLVAETPVVFTVNVLVD